MMSDLVCLCVRQLNTQGTKKKASQRKSKFHKQMNRKNLRALRTMLRQKKLKIFSMSTDKAAAVLSQVATQRINFFIMREGGNRISYNRASHYQLITS